MIQGKGVSPLVWYHPELGHCQAGRLGRLNRDKEEHFSMALRKCDDTHVNIQPPVAPPEINATSLYHLLEMKADFLSLLLLHHGEEDFERAWNEFWNSNAFERRMEEVTL